MLARASTSPWLRSAPWWWRAPTVGLPPTLWLGRHRTGRRGRWLTNGERLVSQLSFWTRRHESARNVTRLGP